jgi:hypothetical protein
MLIFDVVYASDDNFGGAKAYEETEIDEIIRAVAT